MMAVTKRRGPKKSAKPGKGSKLMWKCRFMIPDQDGDGHAETDEIETPVSEALTFVVMVLARLWAEAFPEAKNLDPKLPGFAYRVQSEGDTDVLVSPQLAYATMSGDCLQYVFLQAVIFWARNEVQEDGTTPYGRAVYTLDMYGAHAAWTKHDSCKDDRVVLEGFLADLVGSAAKKVGRYAIKKVKEWVAPGADEQLRPTRGGGAPGWGRWSQAAVSPGWVRHAEQRMAEDAKAKAAETGDGSSGLTPQQKAELIADAIIAGQDAEAFARML